MPVTAIIASVDSELKSILPITNFGSAGEITVGWQSGKASDAHRGVLKFPFSSIPVSDNITAATLALDWSVGAASAEPGEMRNIIVPGIGDPGWVEAEVTWNEARNLALWTSAGGDSDSIDKVAFNLATGSGIVNYDVLSLVLLQRDLRGQANLNILLKRTVEAAPNALGSFRSREGIGTPPTLTLTHSSADLAILTSDDTYLDEAAPTLNRSAIDHLNYRAAGGLESNPVFRFDVGALTGKRWTSAVLRLTYFAVGADPAAGSTIYLSYVNHPVVITTTTWEIYDTGLNWDFDGAESIFDNDYTTRVVWPLSGGHAIDDVVESPDLTALIEKALAENGGILNLIMYGDGSNANPQQFDSRETIGGAAAQLLISGLRPADYLRYRGRPPLKRTPRGIGVGV